MSRFEWEKIEKTLGWVNKETGPLLKAAAERVAVDARNNVPKGTISHGAYKIGYKSKRTGRRKRSVGASWTARKAGSLQESIRVGKSKFVRGGYLVYVGGIANGIDTYYWKFVELGAPKKKGGNPRKPFIVTRGVFKSCDTV